MFNDAFRAQKGFENDLMLFQAKYNLATKIHTPDWQIRPMMDSNKEAEVI